jgi:peptidoglycan/LPS O-acetylase OafA/YrhL
VNCTAIQNPASVESNQSNQSSQSFRGYIPELNAIRAFGITIVILEHMWPYPRVFSKPLDMSWMLMDSFFVLSGFLITGILVDSRSRPDYYLNFYSRRALRILPVYYLLVTALTCASFLLGSGYLYAGIPALYKWGSPWWFFVYLGNIPPVFTGRNPTAVRGSFSPLWSLQIEEQFYLLFPILLHRLNLRTIRRILLGLVCFSPLLRILLYYLYPANAKIQYVFLPCRMEGLALGALIAIRFRMGPWDLPKRTLTVVTLTAIAVALLSAAWGGYGVYSPFNRTVGYLISSIACACVVVWLVRFRGSRITACFRLPPVKHLANISYGAYLFHLTILAALVPISGALRMKGLSQGYLGVVSVFVLTLIFASLSWRFVESPLLRLKEKLFPSQTSPIDLPALGNKASLSNSDLAAFSGVQ